MKATDLNKSPIIFDEAAHRYFLIGDDFSSVQYEGITSVLSKVLFPKKYEGVDEEVLHRAARRGTRIHELCQATDTIPTEPQEGDEAYKQEVENYKALKAEHGITMIANEYLVSNEGWGVASQIDCVDSEANLYDIKTTYTLDREYVSWQLSFYATLFEIQNPGRVAGKLFAVWLRGDKCELVEVPRKPLEQLFHVIDAWSNHETLTTADGEEIESLVTIEEQIAETREQLKALEDKRAKALEPIQVKMTNNGIKTLDGDRIKITIVPDSTTIKFDSKRFKNDYSDLFAQYSTESTRAGYIKTTLL